LVLFCRFGVFGLALFFLAVGTDESFRLGPSRFAVGQFAVLLDE
jgi:hypothetical protein